MQKVSQQENPAELWLAPACHSYREALDENVWNNGCQTWSACADRHDPVRYLRSDIVLPLLQVIEASRQLLPKAEGNCPCGTCQFIRLRDGMLASPLAAEQATRFEVARHSRRLVEQQREVIAGLTEALRQIERWDGFPSTGKTWPESGEPVSYGAAFGSNGERDFMRNLARKAVGNIP
ncbi:hypothetical protein ACBQ16_03785 [Halopseudomonas bauzanensis]|uniref:hypothetical protein n=1 Tax=Halopseudomonas bauzanensis TaxID=653930 RepID=UPI003524CBC0